MEILGHAFADDTLAQRALTTPACKMECPGAKDNQRLEFLGDAVLGLLSAERVYAEFPHEQEGPLTVMRTHMVSTAALCAAAERLGLVALLKRNRGAGALSSRSKTVADAVEAVLGAVYLDGGLAAAREAFERLELRAHAGEGEWSENPKGELQVLVQAMTPPRHPEYETVRRLGPSHDPVFTVRVSVEGLGSATGEAHARREAEARAAAALLAQIRAAQDGGTAS